MKPFQFRAARESGGEHLDQRYVTADGVAYGNIQSGWTFQDFQLAATRHAQICGEERTALIAKRVMGSLDLPIDPKYFSEMIAHYTYEITQRPYMLSVASAQRRPYA